VISVAHIVGAALGHRHKVVCLEARGASAADAIDHCRLPEGRAGLDVLEVLALLAEVLEAGTSLSRPGRRLSAVVGALKSAGDPSGLTLPVASSAGPKLGGHCAAPQ
jgi:hypothetical protein